VSGIIEKKGPEKSNAMKFFKHSNFWPTSENNHLYTEADF